MGLKGFFSDILKKLIVNILTLGIILIAAYFGIKWLMSSLLV